MRRTTPPRPVRSRLRAAASAVLALALGAALAMGATAPARAGAFTIGIAPTNATTQPSGSTFTYQVSLACAATNDPTCDEGRIVIPLDDGVDMTGWAVEAVGGLVVATEIVDGEFVITLPDVIAAGTSQAIELRVTPPNLTTPDGTTWNLLPAVSGDPATTDPAVAPAPATGTATATVPLSVSKSSDRTFYREGETVSYSLTATCPADPPVGSIAAESMTIVDTLPAGLEPVLPLADGGVWDPGARTLTWTRASAESVPEACGGTPGTAGPATVTFEAIVGAVGAEGSGDPLTRYVPVRNAVAVSAEPLGGGTTATGDDVRDIVPLDDGDAPAPGTVNVDKSAAGPVNSSTGTAPRLDATYPGRWLPNGVAPDAPASTTAPAPARYTIEPRTQFPGFEYSLTDPVPCFDGNPGPVYGPSAGVCADPAFHVLGVRLDHPGSTSTGTAPRFVDSTGDRHELVAEASGSGWTSWVVPTAFLGRVAAIEVPRDPAHADRTRDRVTVYGYADAALEDGDVLQNVVDAAWFDPADAPGAAPVASDRDTADLLVVDGPQLGVAKEMSDVGDATGPLARLDLAATLLSPGVPDEPLILADLLPAGASFATARDAVSAQLRPDGGTAVALDADALGVEVIEDFADGRDLLRLTVPAALLPSAGRYVLDLAPIEVRKPVEPGVYANTAHVFYDSVELSGSCRDGAFGDADPLELRGDADATAEHCADDALFRTATSTSGAFDLHKTVQGDYDDEPQEFPNVGHVKLTDGVADYAISWQNTGAPTLTGVVLYDVFPHPGDTGVSGTQAAQPRDSEFRPLLSSVGAAPAGVELAYSASTDPCRPEVFPGQGACVDDWTTDPADLGGLAAVAAVRLVSSESYPTGAGLTWGFQMSVPTVDRDLVAWNSVAAAAESTSGVDLLPTESPKVGITASDERLALEKSVDADAAEPGDLLTYRIEVTNVGTGPSAPTVVTDHLPEGVEVADAGAGVVDVAAGTVAWDVPALDRGESLVVALVVRVAPVQSDAEIVNAASLANPEGYSPPIVGSPCDDDAGLSCARTTVPPTAIATTGAAVGPVGVIAGILLLAGGLLVAASARRRAMAR